MMPEPEAHRARAAFLLDALGFLGEPVGEEGVEDAWAHVVLEGRVRAIVALYARTSMSIAYAAELAGVERHIMHDALRDAGVLRLGYNDERTRSKARELANRDRD